MKISKVDHTMMAIAENEDRIGGLLYKTPEGEIQDLGNRVKWLNKRAIRLYKIFPLLTFSYTTKESYYCAKMIGKAANSLFFGLIKAISSERRMNVFDAMDILYKGREFMRFEQVEYVDTPNGKEKKFIPVDIVKMCEEAGTTVEEQVDLLVLMGARKSIERGGASQIVADTIKKAILKDQYKKVKWLIDEEGMELLLEVLKKDILKKEQLKKVVNSIKKQQPKVSVAKDGEACLLKLSNASHPTKKHVFEFMIEYANATDEEKEELRLHFKKLVLLYVCGLDAYLHADQYGLDGNGFFSREDINLGTFSEDAYQLACGFDNLTDDKGALSNERKKAYGIVKKQITDSYRRVIQTDGLSEADQFWISFIQAEAEKILIKKNNVALGLDYKLKCDYLCKRIWNNWISYIGGKFVEFGKGVFHFVMPDISGNEKEISVKEVQKRFRDGITSFDYEYIKAEETLSKDVAVYTTFAARNFANAVMDYEKIKEDTDANNEDILQYTKKDFQKYCVGDKVTKGILQFFGGIHKWEGTELLKYDAYELFRFIQKNMNRMRNATFHYASEMDRKMDDDTFIRLIVEHEFNSFSELLRKKYYSNNVLMFYGKNDITNLMDFLYDAPKEVHLHVPAFSRILNKSKMPAVLEEYVEKNCLEYIKKQNEMYSIYQSCVLFVLKEIYYHAFICNPDCMSWVYAAAYENMKTADKDDRRANADFISRLDDLKDYTFGEVCYQFMTEVERQNSGHTVNTDGEKQIFKHYRILLYNAIKSAFFNYLVDTVEAQDIFDFLFYPKASYQMEDANDFSNGWQAHHYDHWIDKICKSPLLSSWYITSHFLYKKQFAKTGGKINSYVQYHKNVYSREMLIRNRGFKKDVSEYEDLMVVLKFLANFNGQVSAYLTDYFDDEEDYARYLSNYVDFYEDEKSLTGQYFDSLKEFCAKSVAPYNAGNVDIYYNNSSDRILINRNIVLAKMFGDGTNTEGWYRKITYGDILSYYRMKAELSQSDGGLSVFDKCMCDYPEEQELVCDFQHAINRVELYDVSSFSEITTDLYSQLILWLYSRERDMMYFQLGIAYLCLYYGKKVYANTYLDQMDGDIRFTNGAVLYQIMALNSANMPMYGVRDGKAFLVKKPGNSIGARVGCFFRDFCNRDERPYRNGMFFFENYNLHDEITKMRNDIDHFKYYTYRDCSILDYYGKVYQYFFTYDRKLQKSVTFILTNILGRNHIDATVKMITDDKNSKQKTAIRIDKIKSGLITFKNIKYRHQKPDESDEAYQEYKKRYQIKKGFYMYPIKSDLFLEQLINLLNGS